ncbi:glycosyltransferase [Flavobacterium sp. I-SCBP12n]|uniref:Glycosyltransferase n=1 Tax=Flavobacterium pygoscelis TaxID=2893176 RepID=A0A9X1XQ24_9FLAO|nr:glycosyltransferase [Flavobacterium pygoscelis]MCK8141690.1 glycosyltransferase [Flavobacterium pygoscelis]
MMLSVIMIVYNHSKYIEEAIQGVLKQETDFDFEFIISNDCSTDNSDSLIRSIKNQNTRCKITYYDQKVNLGMMPNFMFALNAANGKYIALCEGDDYWTDASKLQKQVDFLEQNNDFSICFHNVNLEINNTLKEDNLKKRIPSVFGIEELALKNVIHTPSVVYRNRLFPEFPDYFKNAPIGDYFLHLLNAQYGKIKYIDEVMAVYRIHGTSYWSSKSNAEQDQILISFLNSIKINFEGQIQKIIDLQIEKIAMKHAGFWDKKIKKIKRFFDTKK